MKIKNQVVHVSISLAFTIVLLCGCKPSPKESKTSAINPEGVFAQLLRIDAQNESENFEALMAQLVQVADSADLPNPYYWICYREVPDHYWLLTISDSLDNFAHPGSVEGFASSISQFAQQTKRDEITALSEVLKELPVTRNVTQQYSNWSTTNNVESRDFPKSRIVIYQIKEPEVLAFNENMARLSDFLSTNNILFQVEGFIAYPRTMNVAWQVIFLPDHTPFEAVHDNYQFANELDRHTRDELRSIQEKIKATLIGLEYFDGTRMESLSFGTY